MSCEYCEKPEETFCSACHEPLTVMQSNFGSSAAVSYRVERSDLVEALQAAWDKHVTDTGDFPDILHLYGKKISANFDASNFTETVRQELNLLIESKGTSCRSQHEVLL